MLFFGVPSGGMDITALLEIVKGQENHPFVMDLRKNSNYLLRLHKDFCGSISSGLELYTFYETQTSPTPKKVLPSQYFSNGIGLSDI
jgi:hypothetical protein